MTRPPNQLPQVLNRKPAKVFNLLNIPNHYTRKSPPKNQPFSQRFSKQRSMAWRSITPAAPRAVAGSATVGSSVSSKEPKHEKMMHFAGHSHSFSLYDLHHLFYCTCKKHTHVLPQSDLSPKLAKSADKNTVGTSTCSSLCCVRCGKLCLRSSLSCSLLPWRLPMDFECHVFAIHPLLGYSIFTPGQTRLGAVLGMLRKYTGEPN